ncbi:helix-turn-helix transcriptional regulator [Microbacterium sp. CJ88]|uniref:helix-turn-helix transcriptional regulator n=1 Tax=Microbacterium sp. CJ88 TaxID=3445672 RepID=UPI003F659BA6
MTARARTQVDPDRDLRPEFAPYLAIMDFLGALLGPRAEIVLHDTSDLSRSVVALTHGHLSGRSVGAPATDLVLRVLRNHEHDDEPFLANYLAQSAAGGRFRSSTLFIRDAASDVIGMLCINIDDTDLVLARDALTALTSTVEVVKGSPRPTSESSPGEDLPVAPSIVERLSVTVDDLTLDSVSRIVSAGAISPLRMTQTEKIATIRELDRAGVFLLKGSVARVASVLQTSEPTVYRYLRQVRQEA